MLEANHLSVTYGHHRALEDVCVHVAKGEICVILGANGAGKSTLLKTIAGMVAAAPGAEVGIDGKTIAGAKPNHIVEAGIALVPEGRGIFGDLTVAENLELGAYGKQARPYRAEQLAKVLELFPKLAERQGQIARTMSGGEQQMVAIGRALMSNPAILMLDEPSLGLSPLLCSELFRSLQRVRDTGTGLLLVEQNAKQSLAIADRAYLLENGHIIGEGKAADMANDPAVQRAYLGGAADNPATRRLGEAQGNANFSANTSTRVNAAKGEPFHMSDQAHELSQKAGEMARRASDLMAAHITARREQPAPTSSSPPLAEEKPKPAAVLVFEAPTKSEKMKKAKKANKKNNKKAKLVKMVKSAKKAKKAKKIKKSK